MSVKTQAPKDLVVQRLVVAADEIFALFERTFAQYKEGVLRSKFVQQPKDVFPKEDFHLISSGLEAAKCRESLVNQSVMLSVQTQALKDLVVERLVVAADEIFVLFERTFAQYEEEVLQSKYLQQTQTHKEDVQTIIVGLNASTDRPIKEEPIEIKQEVDSPIQIQYPIAILKPDEQHKAEEMRQIGKQCDGDEPGCSSQAILDDNRQPYSCSDVDSDKTTNSNAEETNPNLIKDSTETNVNLNNSFGRNTNPTIATSSTTTTSSNVENKAKIPKCTLCYKTFKSVKALDRHLEFHPGPFTCEICHKDYTDRSNYKKHLRIHSEQKPFRCSVCERGFTQKRHMNEHMRIHTGEKPLSCSQCGMTFRQKNSLMRHVLSKHSEDKPYSCPICLKGFVQKWHLMVHMRGHTGERPFSCSICGKSYESKCYLKKHVDRNHKADGEVLNDVMNETMDPESEDLWGLEPLCPGPQPPLLDNVDNSV
ncbi:hypothetical protein WMY93_007047 [Mugilogobius chulae]|uniref:C2H2-type domain-containing protein n=1 Tax=Mugilogobius chulae TaxID=88201 RepID=A0AAW0PLZ5_9GOBI